MLKRTSTLCAVFVASSVAGCRLTADVDRTSSPGVAPDAAATGMVTRIQSGEFYPGTQLSIEAVVTGVEHADDGPPDYNFIGISGLYVSDPLATAAPYGGIYVQLPIDAPLGQYQTGDLLQVSAFYSEYYNSSRLEEPEIVKVGDRQVPAPAPVDPATVATLFIGGSGGYTQTDQHGELAASYEGVLIKVENVFVSQEDLGFGMFEVTGGLAIDPSLYFLEPANRPFGTGFTSITGLLVFSFDAYKLAPRTREDFVP